MWQKIIFNFNRAAPSLLIYHAWPTFPRWKGHHRLLLRTFNYSNCLQTLRSLAGEREGKHFFPLSQFSHLLYNRSWGQVHPGDLPAFMCLPNPTLDFSHLPLSHLLSTERCFEIQVDRRMKRGQVPEWQKPPTLTPHRAQKVAEWGRGSRKTER